MVFSLLLGRHYIGDEVPVSVPIEEAAARGYHILRRDRLIQGEPVAVEFHLLRIHLAQVFVVRHDRSTVACQVYGASVVSTKSGTGFELEYIRCISKGVSLRLGHGFDMAHSGKEPRKINDQNDEEGVSWLLRAVFDSTHSAWPPRDKESVVRMPRDAHLFSVGG